MKVNIKRAIQSIKGDVDFFQPLYEAIVNSFQAEAENLKSIFTNFPFLVLLSCT
jgi:hypothetical protein